MYMKNSNLRKELVIAIESKETSSQLEPIRYLFSYMPIMYQPVTVSFNMQSNACTNKGFSSTSTRFNSWCYHFYILYQPKQGLKLVDVQKMLYMYMHLVTCLSCQLQAGALYSYIIISNWFMLTTCFLTFYCDQGSVLSCFYFYLLLFLEILFSVLLCLRFCLKFQHFGQSKAMYIASYLTATTYTLYTSIAYTHHGELQLY